VQRGGAATMPSGRYDQSSRCVSYDAAVCYTPPHR